MTPQLSNTEGKPKDKQVQVNTKFLLEIVLYTLLQDLLNQFLHYSLLTP